MSVYRGVECDYSLATLGTGDEVFGTVIVRGFEDQSRLKAEYQTLVNGVLNEAVPGNIR